MKGSSISAPEEIEFSIEDRSRYVRALYTYEAKDDTQLSIEAGDILEVFYRDDSGWWDGKNVNTLSDGYFPGSYTEALGDNLNAIKQELIFDTNNELSISSNKRSHNNTSNHNRHKSTSITDKESSIEIRNADSISHRCKKTVRNDCKLCTIHCQSLLVTMSFEYDAFRYRSLSVIQHTLCIFGAVSLNHFLTVLVNSLHSLPALSNMNNVWIRLILTSFLSFLLIIFLFLTSQTALEFLQLTIHYNPLNAIRNKKKKRISKFGSNYNANCADYVSIKCGECGVKSCKPYTFIYTQFLMLLFSYILAFCWGNLLVHFETEYFNDRDLHKNWYKNLFFLIVPLFVCGCIVIWFLVRKLNSVYHIYRYYSKQERDVIVSNYNDMPLQLQSKNANNNRRPYQVSLYLYFWCLLSEISLFMFALPCGICLSSFVYSLLYALKIWDHRQTRIILTVLFIACAILLIYAISRKLIGPKTKIMYRKRDNNNKKMTMSENADFNSENGDLQSNLTVNSVMTMNDGRNMNRNMMREYESDIPDFIVMILMKYYGREMEESEFGMLSMILIFCYFCDILVIGCWYNVWKLFDSNNSNLLFVCILTICLPLICSYLFGKTFKYYCCRRKNYKLSILLESDKLWIKSLLSRWFVVIQALILGYCWCEYFQYLLTEYIIPKTQEHNKYHLLAMGGWCAVVYAVIFMFIAVFKLNKKLLQLLWSMHDENDDSNDANSNNNDNNDINKPIMIRQDSPVANLGLNASVKKIENQLNRRLTSQKTISAQKAKVVCVQNSDNNTDQSIIIENDDKNGQKTLLKMTDLSTALLDDDDDDDHENIL